MRIRKSPFGVYFGCHRAVLHYLQTEAKDTKVHSLIANYFKKYGLILGTLMVCFQKRFSVTYGVWEYRNSLPSESADPRLYLEHSLGMVLVPGRSQNDVWEAFASSEFLGVS